MAVGPRCLRWSMLTWSGLVDLLFLLFFMVSVVMAVVIFIGLPFSNLILLSVILLLCEVWCSLVFMNCLLNCVAFSLSVYAVVVVNCIVLLGSWHGASFESDEIVFQRMCVLCLLFQF
jgi:hypothetical protein